MAEQTDLFGQVPAKPAPLARGIKLGCKPCPEAFRVASARIGSLMPRERIVYHTGDLSNDRMDDAALSGTAAAYQEAADRGVLILSQRRIGPMEFEYLAIKRGR